VGGRTSPFIPLRRGTLGRAYGTDSGYACGGSAHDATGSAAAAVYFEDNAVFEEPKGIRGGLAVDALDYAWLDEVVAGTECA
jgi:hypothetical protein